MVDHLFEGTQILTQLQCSGELLDCSTYVRSAASLVILCIDTLLVQ